MSKNVAFQAILTVSSGNFDTLSEAMSDLQSGITKKVKKLKEREGDVNVVSVSHSSSHSATEGYFASATIIVDVLDSFTELVLEEAGATSGTEVSG